MIGRSILHFQVVEKLGEGGMGVVYKARDTHLDRFVALKVLQPDAVANPDRRRRFVQEAKAASALNHPNIVHVYDIGESEGALFIAMEYVAGQTLDQRLRPGRLALAEALRLAAQIGDALTAAHAAGIVHRDLKPSNVMVNESGLVKVLDFGLAKLMEAEEAEDSGATASIHKASPRTEAGMVMGTAAYMSPEQAEGRKVDARSDIFSFGAVLYEMITGRAAFSGPSRMATLSAVMRDEPPPLTQAVEGTPSELERVVQRCLRKDPLRRSQNMADLKVQLEEIREQLASGINTPAPAQPARPARPAWIAKAVKSAIAVAIAAAAFAAYWFLRPGETIDSLAVLPFSNVGGDPATEYLSDGITEGLINSLAQLPNLKVASRSSAGRVKDSDLKRAAADLGVRALLLGKVRQQGDALSISVELVDGRDSSHLWGEHYERKASELTAVEQEITHAIAGKLQRNLSGEQSKQIAKRYSTNSEAYQLYLKGRYDAEKYTKDGALKGIEYFNQAIATDPNFAPAYDGLSYAYALGTDLWWGPQEAMPKARAAAERALQLDDTLAEAHVEMANVRQWYEYDWAGAEREFQRAIELKPDYAKAHEYYGWFLLTVGRTEQALEETRRAKQLDPLSTETSAMVGQNLYFAHHYREATEEFRRLLEMEPNIPFARMFLGFSFEAQRNYPAALVELERAWKEDPSSGFILSGVAHAAAASGKRADAERHLEELKAFAKKNYLPAYNLATVYAALGDKQEALTLLEKGYSDRSTCVTFMPVDPYLDPLRSEPRFKDLLKKMGL